MRIMTPEEIHAATHPHCVHTPPLVQDAEPESHRAIVAAVCIIGALLIVAIAVLGHR